MWLALVVYICLKFVCRFLSPSSPSVMLLCINLYEYYRLYPLHQCGSYCANKPLSLESQCGFSVPASLFIICDVVIHQWVISLSIVPAPPVRIVLRQEVIATRGTICRVSRVATPKTTFANNLRIVPTTVCGAKFQNRQFLTQWCQVSHQSWVLLQHHQFWIR